MPRAKKTYRILSLDGGGIRGIITAVWLNRLEEILGGRLRNHFDLVAGTSTGSILACAVSAGIDTGKVIDLYQSHGRDVFPGRARRWLSRLSRVFTEGPSAPKYDGKGLQNELKRLFKTLTFGQLKIKPTLVTAYNTLERQAVVLKNTTKRFQSIPVWEVCKASSAAPTFFPAHILRIRRRKAPLIDGGVVANNPTACAIAEAAKIQAKRVENKQVPMDRFVVASFGTGAVTRPIEIEDVLEWGALEWAIPIIDVLFDGASDAVDYIASKLTSENRYYRFQTQLSSAYDDMDNAEKTNINALLSTAARHLSAEGGEAKLEKLAKALK
ncbi:MAG: patatin-like phospholipase family protein [Planctomycetota bacterium]|nr:patatin-like phospholipase family protein [Planctomycetota bacterium]